MLQKTPMALSMPRFRLDFATSGTSPSPNSVLVALDGALAAEQALPFAELVAKQWNAPLRLVHVLNPIEDAQRIDVSLLYNTDSRLVQTRLSAYLRDTAESLRGSNGISVSWETVTGVSVADTLRSICETDARALVMARSRRSLLSRFWWGSVTDSLIGRLTVSLLVIPEGASRGSRAGSAPERGFSRVLVYADGSEATDQVVDSAIAICPADAVCHLLRVLPLASLYAAGRGGFAEASDHRNQAWHELFKAREKLEKHGLAVKSRLIFDGQTAGPAIIDQARAMQAQLIVVAARQHLLPWWLRDGVAEYVLRHAHVPVLIVPVEGNFTPQREINHVDVHSN
jgi:nucleotide-binding universal stress UspA family protein